MKKEKIIIIGAGLCGTLLALRLAQREYEVIIYEKRPDPRAQDFVGGRSINLALSKRGLKALDLVGMKDEILEHCIPMHGRMIHPKSGESWNSPYSGRKGDYINSVSREGLNLSLLEAADKFENLKVFFNCKVERIDLKEASIEFIQDGEQKKDKGKLVIGTDGAGSVVRKSMMAQTTKLLFNYKQDFLRHGYKELSIAPSEGGDFKLFKNALHIWPRGQYMIIALPNLDKSFTVTMFHPYEGAYGFNTLQDESKVLNCFREEYPSLLELIPNLQEEYASNPVGTLGTIQCYPWQAYGKSLVMGDASHAIVPFYGQGMNAAFEDVSIFDEILNQYQGDWNKVLYEFQESRKPDADAIASLAVDNFYEMRDHVDDAVFIQKRKLEMQLEQTFDNYYSKYSMVTFREELPYSEAMNKGRKQDTLLLELCKSKAVDSMDLATINQKVNQLKDGGQ